MHRIVILGPPGSGKSTLARHLGARLGLPVFHLDQFYWQPGWVEAPAETFRAAVERLTALPAWVIDGNYTDTIAPHFQTADVVVYLDTPSWLSVWRVIWRTARNWGEERADTAPGCPERLNVDFLHFVWRWNSIRRARTLALIASFNGKKLVLAGGGLDLKKAADSF